MSKMEKCALVPKLRFGEFEGEWEITRLANTILSMDSGWSPQCESQPASEGKWAVLKTTSVVWDGYQQNQNKALPSTLAPRPDIEVKVDDILITRAGPSERVGVVAHIYKSRNKLMLSDKLIRIKSNKHINSAYLSIVLKSAKTQSQISALKSGLAKSQTNITQKDLKKLKLHLPTLSEQKKIAAFLTAVDERIDQLKRKKSLLQDYKKGVMQQLFTQQLRFKDNNGNNYPDWELKKLGELCSTFKSGSGITASEINSIGNYPVYGGNGLRGYAKDYTHDGVYVLIGRQGALCGNINLVKGKSFISEHAIAIQANSSSSNEWIAHFLDYMKLNRLSESSAQPGLAVGKLVKIKLSTPCLPEQTKIANYLTSLDQKLTQTTTQITQTQTFKKALLQQMFV